MVKIIIVAIISLCINIIIIIIINIPITKHQLHHHPIFVIISICINIIITNQSKSNVGQIRLLWILSLPLISRLQ